MISIVIFSKVVKYYFSHQELLGCSLALELPNKRSFFVEGNGFKLSNSEVVHFMREGFNGPNVNLMILIHKFVLVLPKIRHWYALERGQCCV